MAAVLSLPLSFASAQNVKLADATPGAPVAAPDTAATGQTSLPNGATALTETYGEWMVACSMQNATQHCVAQHKQINPQTQQAVLAIELAPTSDKGDRIDGTAVLPFGLALASGMSLQIDDRPALSTLPFRTCMPGGCVIMLNFDAKATTELRNGAVLKAKVVADGGTDLVIPISLNGLGAALDRTAVWRTKDARRK
jgi:invasion protein IalB